MAEYAPPTGPPPPKVPEGWKAVWNDQYSEWFFVNIYTKKSQWDKPTEPVYPPGEAPPDQPPPSYVPGAVGSNATGTSEKSTFSSNNPYANSTNLSDDEKYARQLQEEEQARARSHGPGNGASNDYYNQSQQGGYPQQGGASYGQSQTPMHDDQSQERGSGKSKGLLGKLMSKASGHKSSSSGSYGGYPQQQHYGQQQHHGQPYGQPGYGPPMGAPMGGGYYQQPGRPMMGGPMMGGGMGGRRPGGGGMGAGGALALGAGGGLLGGALLGSAMSDGGDTYIENNDYGDDGGDMGGDMGDMGGDF